MICRSLAAMVLLLCACSDKEEKPPDSVPSPIPVAVETPRATTSASPCPHTGLWAPCTLEKRLRQAGFVVKKSDDEPVKRPGFSIAPTVYSLGTARIEVFFYPDTLARRRDMVLIDTLVAGPPGSQPVWESTPVFIQSANLSAVLLLANPRQAERMRNAITAGAPQPGSSR